MQGSSNITHTEYFAAKTVTQGPFGEGLPDLAPPSLSCAPCAHDRGVGGEALLWEAPGGAPGCQRAGDCLPRGGLCDHAAGMRDAGGGESLLEGRMQEQEGPCWRRGQEE